MPIKRPPQPLTTRPPTTDLPKTDRAKSAAANPRTPPNSDERRTAYTITCFNKLVNVLKARSSQPTSSHPRTSTARKRKSTSPRVRIPPPVRCGHTQYSASAEQPAAQRVCLRRFYQPIAPTRPKNNSIEQPGPTPQLNNPQPTNHARLRPRSAKRATPLNKTCDRVRPGMRPRPTNHPHLHSA